MADKKISALTASTTPLAGTEVLPIVQGGSTVKVSIANVTAGRAVAASSLTTTGNINTTGGILKVDASGLSSGLQVDGYAPGAAFNGFITNNDASAGTASRLSLGRTTASVFGFIQTNNNTEAVEVGTDGAVRLTASKVGDITANTGNLVIGTAGKGIDFSANGGDVLTQYEEGAWTPTFTTWSVAPTNVAALYTRVGRQVTLNMIAQGGTCIAGSEIGGFPFTAGNSASSVLAHDGTANSIAFTGTVYNLDNKVSGISAATLGAGYWGMSVTYFV